MSDEELLNLRKNAKLPLTHELLDHIEAAKLREAELERDIETVKSCNQTIVECYQDDIKTLTQDRDAALSALEIARTALQTVFDAILKMEHNEHAFRCCTNYNSVRIEEHAGDCPRQIAVSVLRGNDPSAALAERGTV